jgi:hypothetical protein
MKRSSYFLFIISILAVGSVQAASITINSNAVRLLKDGNLDPTLDTGYDEDGTEQSSESILLDPSVANAPQLRVVPESSSSSEEDVLIPFLPLEEPPPQFVPSDSRQSSSVSVFQPSENAPSLTVSQSSSQEKSSTARASSAPSVFVPSGGEPELTVVSSSSSSVQPYALTEGERQAATLQEEYPEISAIVPTEEGADATVETPASLFGFIPVTMPITLHMTEETIDVDKPWWAFLAWDQGGDIESIAFIVMQQAAQDAQDDLKGIMKDVQDATRGQQESSTQTQVETGVERAKQKLDSMSEMGEMESLRLQMAMDRLSKLMETLSNLLKKTSETSQGIIQNMK